MSYEISYRQRAFVIPMARTGGHYDDVFFLVEEVGSNNCIELDSRRRVRNWVCLAAGGRSDCLAEITRCAASCCGGSLQFYGRRDTSPESYIRAWRKALAAALPFDEAPRNGFYLQLFTRISDTDAQEARRYAFKQASAQTLVAPKRGKDRFTDADYTEWRFNAAVPEQVKLWLETRTGGRGFFSVDAAGPDR